MNHFYLMEYFSGVHTRIDEELDRKARKVEAIGREENHPGKARSR